MNFYTTVVPTLTPPERPHRLSCPHGRDVTGVKRPHCARTCGPPWQCSQDTESLSPQLSAPSPALSPRARRPTQRRIKRSSASGNGGGRLLSQCASMILSRVFLNYFIAPFGFSSSSCSLMTVVSVLPHTRHRCCPGA